MDYFYAPPDKIVDKSVIIDGSEFAHLVHVMRKKEGDSIRVVDGVGNAYDCRLGEMKRHMVRGTIDRSYTNHHEPTIELALAVGILKNPSKFDFLVEKATELGVREILPMTTERTIPQQAKVDRWQKLALAAMKQCGRSFLPMIRSLTTLDEVLTQRDRFSVSLIAHEEDDGTHDAGRIFSARHRSLLILIGPEGGFSDEEVEHATTAGCTRLYLGERRLRTETAAIASLALANLVLA